MSGDPQTPCGARLGLRECLRGSRFLRTSESRERPRGPAPGAAIQRHDASTIQRPPWPPSQQKGLAPAAAWSGVPRRVTVTPSPVAVIEKVPAVLEVYVYAPQAGDPPCGEFGIEAMNGPALSLSPLTAGNMRTVNAGGRVPMWAAYRRTAQARALVSARALA